MRAELTEDYREQKGAPLYVQRQIVKGATAKFLVNAGVADEVEEPKMVFARMNKAALGVADGTLIKGENAEIAIAAGIADEVDPSELTPAKPKSIGHPATVSTGGK